MSKIRPSLDGATEPQIYALCTCALCLLASCVLNPTLAHFRHFSSLLTNLPSTSVESPLQISSFMQNKANLLDAQMNVNKVLTKNYENVRLRGRRKNKPNTKPIKANFRKAKMNLNFYLTKDYENKPRLRAPGKQTQSNPIKLEANLSLKGANIPTGELLAILKPGTNQTQFPSKKHAFLPIFYQIFIAYFTQTPQTNSTTPIFHLKTTIPPKITKE